MGAFTPPGNLQVRVLKTDAGKSSACSFGTFGRMKMR